MTREYISNTQAISLKVKGINTVVPIKVLEDLIATFPGGFKMALDTYIALEEEKLRSEVEQHEAKELQRAIDILTNLKNK